MRWLLLIPAFVIVFILSISFYLQPNNFSGCKDIPETSGHCQKVDAIVVVSGGDTNARTDRGIELFKNGWADVIIFSGAAQDKTGLSNAAAMRKRALQDGVAATSIYVEEYSETTEQNAENTQSIFETRGFEKVMLVTSGYHQRRAFLEFEKRSGSTQILNYPLAHDKDWNDWWWVSPRGWWLAGGELAKIVAFYVTGSTR